MNKTEVQRDALRLPPEDRLEIAEALYRSLDPEPLADWQKDKLDERLAAADAHPERFSTWDEAKARIESKIASPSHRR